MSTAAVAVEAMPGNTSSVDPRSSGGRSALVAWSVASGLGLVLIAAGLAGSIPLHAIAWATLYLFFAVASDVGSHRVPNVLTFPALLGALLLSPWLSATGGPLEAAIGATLGFALLVGPYAAGGLGAGDVKSLMALGAWLGPATILGACVWALIAAGGIGLALLVVRGELKDFALRWYRTIVISLTHRRLEYEPPAEGSTAAGGIPFMVTLAVGLAIQWIGGSPW